ncbi:MAG: FAD-dependent monooxygenase [Nodosilinea sp.]
MEYYETIIVGAGPAGSTCARKLAQAGRSVLMLDKATFPRLKLCAGWVTGEVWRDLEMTPSEYPHSLLQLSTRLYISPFPFALMPWPTRWVNYSIRRIEFDQWLVERSGVGVRQHQVNHIDYQDGTYIIDGQLACTYLIGAGGTGCPVRRQFFPRQRPPEDQIVALEQEFYYPDRDGIARYFCFERGLAGYSWYIPKGDGYLNLGLGGFNRYFQGSSLSIHDHFQAFLKDLVRRRLLSPEVADQLRPAGYSYYLASGQGPVKQDRCWLIGDSAGLATLDLGEGISPAIKSGLLAAGEVLGETVYTRETIFNRSLRPGWQWLRGFLPRYSPSPQQRGEDQPEPLARPNFH